MKRPVAKISNHSRRLLTFASDVIDHSRRLAKVANLRFALLRVQSKRTLSVIAFEKSVAFKNLQKFFSTLELCGKFVNLWAKTIFFVFLRLPEVCGKLAKILSVDLFFGQHFRAVSLALASSNPVLGLERICPLKVYPRSWIFCVLDLGLEPCVLDFTSAICIMQDLKRV